MAAESPNLSTLLGLGAVVAGTLAVGMGLGWLVDSIADTNPIFVLVGLAVGVAGAVAYVVSQFRQILRDNSSPDGTERQ